MPGTEMIAEDIRMKVMELQYTDVPVKLDDGKQQSPLSASWTF